MYIVTTIARVGPALGPDVEPPLAACSLLSSLRLAHGFLVMSLTLFSHLLACCLSTLHAGITLR